jgi:hypothetical protein
MFLFVVFAGNIESSLPEKLAAVSYSLTTSLYKKIPPLTIRIDTVDSIQG